MRVLFRRNRQQEDHPQHDRVAVFIGKQHEMKLSGELIMSDEEWEAFQHWNDHLQDLESAYTHVGDDVETTIIVEDRMGSPIP